METSIYETNFPTLRLSNRGKVRDVYDLGDALLVVATDRISAFDVVMPTPIPGKGRILTEMSNFWFDVTSDVVPNHLIATEFEKFPAPCAQYKDMLDGRSMFVKKATPLPVECIVRGYISGSGWQSYLEDGSVCGIPLPKGLRESEKLPRPLFTPSTKANAGGHDENISFDQLTKLIGAQMADRLETLSIQIYSKAAELALTCGIILADTKFEFGIVDGELILIDEVLTPDSSRFWPLDSYEPGGPQESFDKQYVRDYLTAIGWNKKPPAPTLPTDVVNNTQKRYEEALIRLTRKKTGF